MTKNSTNPKQVGEESEPRVPTDLQKALTASPMVEAVWNSLTPLARWDFIIWVDEAKQLDTRKRRIEKACSMLATGKRHH